MSRNSVFVKAGDQYFKVNVTKSTKNAANAANAANATLLGETATGEGQGSAAPRPASNVRRNNGSNPTEASGSEANQSGPGNPSTQNNQSWMAEEAAALGPAGANNSNWMAEQAAASRAREEAAASRAREEAASQAKGGRRRNKRKGTRRNKRKGTRRNKRN
jgi:hypothetical protein